MRVRSMRFAVIGTGLIGGSLLRRLANTGVDVVGWDPDPATAALARQWEIPWADDLATAVTDRDIVFLATPLATLPETLERIAGHVAGGCIVTDVGSTKAAIASAARSGPLADRFIPGHPMAGTERSGLAAADPDLFDGAAWVLCPDSRAALSGVRTLIAAITTVFDARVTLMSPDEHDTAVALSSHIPHLLAGTLAAAVGDSGVQDAVIGLAAGSFRDGTRVAGTAPARTVDMLVHNRSAVLRQWEGVEALLGELTAALRDNDAPALTRLLQRSQRVRTALVDRELSSRTRRFALDDEAAEFGFLTATGSRGAYVTACAITGETVDYSLLD